MTTQQMSPFLALARDWRAAAEALRSAGAAEGDPALRVWREVVWCHVLFGRGRHHAALASLRAAVRAVTGEPPPVARPPVGAAEAASSTAELFDYLRAAVSARPVA